MGRYLTKGKKELIFSPQSLPFQICHASNLCILDDGTVLAAWFAGSKEGEADVGIWCSRKTQTGWSEPVMIAHDKEEAHWNPVMFQKQTGEVLLFYKVGSNIKEWYTNVRTSTDRGKTWSEASELVPGDRGGRGPVRCKPVQISDGSILAGASTEDGIWTSYADCSSDGGKTWMLSNPIRLDVDYHGENTAEESDIEVSAQSFFGRGVIQPTIWESEGGKVHMLLRSTEEEIYRSDSYDFGKNWCKAYTTRLPNNNSGIDVVKCSNGMLVLCSNPVRKNWGARSPITLHISPDNGNTWTEEYVLENAMGEYSYPSVVEQDGVLLVSYTYDRKSIAYWEFKVEEYENEKP